MAPRSGRNCDPADRRSPACCFQRVETAGWNACYLPAGVGQTESGLAMWATSRKVLSSVGHRCFQYLTFFSEKLVRYLVPFCAREGERPFVFCVDGTFLTLNLLTTTIVAPPSNASKWQMGFNSAFKGLNMGGIEK